MRKVILLPIFLLMFSCYLFQEKGIDFKIVNNSKHNITDIIITTSENSDSSIFERLEPNESISGFLKMKNAKTDGSYVLEYSIDEEEKFTFYGGYYSNGIPSKEFMNIEILPDTALINFEFVP